MLFDIIWRQRFIDDIASFIADFCSQFSDSFDAYLLVVLLMAIDGKKQVGYQTAKDLNHEPVFASGDQVIHFKVAFPPAKKLFDLPAQFVNHRDLFG